MKNKILTFSVFLIILVVGLFAYFDYNKNDSVVTKVNQKATVDIYYSNRCRYCRLAKNILEKKV